VASALRPQRRSNARRRCGAAVLTPRATPPPPPQMVSHPPPESWLCAVCAVGHVGCCVCGGYPVGVSIYSSPVIHPQPDSVPLVGSRPLPGPLPPAGSQPGLDYSRAAKRVSRRGASMGARTFASPEVVAALAGISSEAERRRDPQTYAQSMRLLWLGEHHRYI